MGRCGNVRRQVVTAQSYQLSWIGARLASNAWINPREVGFSEAATAFRQSTGNGHFYARSAGHRRCLPIDCDLVLAGAGGLRSG